MIVHLYFQVHQPRRLRATPFLSLGTTDTPFDDNLNASILQKVAGSCYIPANKLLLRLLMRHPELKVTFSLSGVAIDQMRTFAPEALDTFRALAETGSVEFLSETYYHSLASLSSREEFREQVRMHQDITSQLFQSRSSVFRNTELIYSEEIGKWVRELGYTAILTDGIDRMPGTISPHRGYVQADTGLRILLRDYKLSDDIAFRFSNKRWKEWPLTASKYMKWLEAVPDDDDIINLGLDYETLGEHQSKDTSIFKFVEGWLTAMASSKRLRMATATQAITQLPTGSSLRVNSVISWADQERDTSAWLGNDMQREAFETCYALESKVKARGDARHLETWRYLQTSDHFYYMSTKQADDGAVHAYFSPYPSPHEAFINYMNVLKSFSMRL